MFAWSKRKKTQRSMKTGICWVKGMSCFWKTLGGGGGTIPFVENHWQNVTQVSINANEKGN